MLQANLYEARLSGHGLTENPLANVRAENWLQDAADALATGAAIGDRIIVIGTSTGATLAAAMLDHELANLAVGDTVVSPQAALDVFNATGSTQRMAEAIVGFIERPVP